MVYLCELNINIISRDISPKDLNISATDIYVAQNDVTQHQTERGYFQCENVYCLFPLRPSSESCSFSASLWTEFSFMLASS